MFCFLPLGIPSGKNVWDPPEAGDRIVPEHIS
jgi:hypothetical protein